MKMREITGENMNKKHIGPSEYLGFLSQVSQFIDPQIVRDAADFDYGQWELPFEAVLIELMRMPRNEIEIDFNAVELLAKEADITEEGVINPESWRKFLDWYHSNTT
ncbi:hypothetical protein [Agrobacterium sp. SUL3]|uniref:hypothetical protein n=1 Tax=Agrobacterium sp. SUL3 TaxID=1701910 RepID=UPI000AF95954|nr:hypothetical protein [Agrobacterium sp. SUL3]